MLVRTWNLFHGNAVPPERRAHLREMVELVTADGPDVVCLQEIPVWAMGKLEGWSGMRTFTAVGAQPLLRSAEVGRWLTELNHGLLRSAVTGEGLALLLSHRLEIREERRHPVGPNRVLLGVVPPTGRSSATSTSPAGRSQRSNSGACSISSRKARRCSAAT